MALKEIAFNVLCNVCQTMLNEDHSEALEKPWTFDHHSLRGLEKSADMGCHLCSIFWGGFLRGNMVDFLRNHWPRVLRERKLQLKFKAYCDFLGPNSLKALAEYPAFWDRRFWDPETGLSAPTFSCDTPSQENPGPARASLAVSNNTASQQSFEQLKAWLSSCLREHEVCSSDPASILPSRLVQILDIDQDFSLRLWDTGRVTHDSEHEYTTLSYYWGQRNFPKLSLANHISFNKAIPSDELPLTIREAILLTQKLGKHYIWIDALCIIQDCPEDWQSECARMSDIYTGSFLNISASASQDVYGGLFRQRYPLRWTACMTDMRWRGLKGDKLIWNSQTIMQPMWNCPVSRRAWCFQERFLAPRTIHFCEEQLFWDRKEMRASETRSWDAEDTVRISSSPSLTDAWTNDVHEYTRAELTIKSDKLVAISGIARKLDQIYNNIGGVYLSGLWNSNLIFELCWTTIPPDRWTPRRWCSRSTDGYIAPSWSWASVDGEIIPGSRLIPGEKRTIEEIHLDVLEAVTMPIGDRFGAVSDGYLRVRGPLFAVKINAHLEQKEQSREDFYEASFPGISCAEWSTTLALDDHVWYDMEPSKGEGISQALLYMLPILSYIEHKTTHLDSFFKITGMLLMRTYAKKGQYVRVGCIEFYKETDVSAVLKQAFQQASGAKSLKDDEYEYFDGKDQCTIEIR